MFGDVKSFIFGLIPGGFEAGQIYLGLILYVLTLAALRRGLSDPAGLAVLLLIGLAIEVADVVLLGQSARRAMPDLLHFVLAPLFLFAVARFRFLKI